MNKEDKQRLISACENKGWRISKLKGKGGNRHGKARQGSKRSGGDKASD
jgi:hypothetical protein